jgi:sorbitol/mannitol transport system permease protein
MTTVADVPSQALAAAARAARPTWQARMRRRAPLLPALIFTVIVTQIPFLVTLVLSTFHWNAQHEDRRSFAGLANYLTVFTDDRLRTAVINTIVLTAVAVLVSVLLGLGLAILLDRRFPGRGLARTLLIAPFLVMPVASALLWKHALYNPDYGLFNGVLNSIWKLFGADHGPTIDWISLSPMGSVVAALVWQWTPFMMLILLAGLQAQPGDILEAARVDGASGVQMFRWLTLPHLQQYLELAVLLGSIYLLQTFDAVYTITQGGPGTATTNLPYEIYLTMFRKYEYGESAAAGVVVVIGTIIVATYALRVVSSLFREEYGR